MIDDLIDLVARSNLSISDANKVCDALRQLQEAVEERDRLKLWKALATDEGNAVMDARDGYLGLLQRWVYLYGHEESSILLDTRAALEAALPERSNDDE